MFFESLPDSHPPYRLGIKLWTRIFRTSLVYCCSFPWSHIRWACVCLLSIVLLILFIKYSNALNWLSSSLQTLNNDTFHLRFSQFVTFIVVWNIWARRWRERCWNEDDEPRPDMNSWACNSWSNGILWVSLRWRLHFFIASKTSFHLSQGTHSALNTCVGRSDESSI